MNTGEEKMSQFGESSLAEMKTAGAGVPVFVAGQSNKRIPASDIAGSYDLSQLSVRVSSVSSSIAPDYSTLTFPVAEKTFCTRDGRMYYCSIAGGIQVEEEWTPSHWTESDISSALAGKVDDEQGKGLSTNDFTNAFKAKLEGIQNRAAAQGGQDDSLVKTGDKFFWNSWASENYEVPTLEQVVTIGGRDYSTVQIGNRIWMAETLDCKFDGMTFVGPDGSLPSTNSKVNSPYCYYYDRLSSSTGGLFYTFGAVKYLIDHPELLPSGWRVPSMTDFADLKAAAGDNSGTHLKATSGWANNGNGDDSTGFNAVPAGEQWPNGMFGDRDVLLTMWSSDYVTPISTGSDAQVAYLSSDTNTMNFTPIMNTAAECLRLCRDA